MNDLSFIINNVDENGNLNITLSSKNFVFEPFDYLNSTHVSLPVPAKDQTLELGLKYPLTVLYKKRAMYLITF